MSAQLARLIYASTIAESGADSMEKILTAARRNNPREGITGVLCRCDRFFLQVLEGGRQIVSDRFLKIATDPRHTQVTLLYYQDISERRFGNWTMGHVHLHKINAGIILKYSSLPKLEPYELSGSIALALLEEIAATSSLTPLN